MATIWKDAITDRSEDDVKKVKELLMKDWQQFTDEEKAKWTAGLKGSLNTVDRERISNNISVLAEVLEVDIDIPVVSDTYTKHYEETVVTAIKTIRDMGYVRTTTPDTPQRPLTNYKKWNDIEKILQDVYELLCSNFFYYAGSEYYSGSDIGLLN